VLGTVDNSVLLIGKFIDNLQQIFEHGILYVFCSHSSGAHHGESRLHEKYERCGEY
jgi:hypothetical protein